MVPMRVNLRTLNLSMNAEGNAKGEIMRSAFPSPLGSGKKAVAQWCEAGEWIISVYSFCHEWRPYCHDAGSIDSSD
jgi:hypothetical protein